MFVRQYKENAGGQYWTLTWKNTSAESLMEQNRQDPLYPFLKEELVPGSTALEVGVGLGNWCRLFPEIKWYGVDTDEEVIARLGLEAPEIVASVGSAERTMLSPVFDYVCSWGVLEHSDTEQEMINEAFRVLKPGGKAFFSVPYINHLRTLVLSWIAVKNWYNKGCGYAFHQKIYEKSHLVPLLERAGFVNVKVRPLGRAWDAHMLLLEATKPRDY